jgi:two-component system, NtrC family, sensor histidine kinase HydH
VTQPSNAIETADEIGQHDVVGPTARPGTARDSAARTPVPVAHAASTSPAAIAPDSRSARLSPPDTIGRPNEAFTELATLAGGLAHEIRNPLSTIGLNLDLVAEELQLTGTPRDLRVLKRIDVVRDQCERLETLLDQFVQFARAGMIRREPIDLSAIVHDFIEFYRPEADAQRVEISPHLAGDLPPLRLDRALVDQMLHNLARNALQAMPAGGTLELQTALVGEWVRLEVIDSGRGMPRDALSHLFEPFYSTKTAGSGLGLPTVKRIVEAHGGRIECQSEPGRGTRMTVLLPVGA